VLLLVCAWRTHTSPFYGAWAAELRIELLMSVFAGTSGGLAGLVWSRLVSSAWIAHTSRGASRGTDAEPVPRQLAAAALFAIAGAALGLLYWLGWGLISLVNAPWYATGLVFGGLAWLGVALPMLGTLALRLHGSGGTALVLAVEWLVTCAAAGLSCALAWHRYA
jgi:hypothetical protein